MEAFLNFEALKSTLSGVVSFTDDGDMKLLIPKMLRGEFVDRLVTTANFGSSKRLRDAAYTVIRKAAFEHNIWSDSIAPFYSEMANNRIPSLTVPAFNIRGLTYCLARRWFRSAKKYNAGPAIFELSPTEMGYTNQPPKQYISSILGAALRENYSGPLFLQGDHFKMNLNQYNADSSAEKDKLLELVNDAIDAGFYNIDIDGSVHVNLNAPTVELQQKPNIEVTDYFIRKIREIEPDATEIAIGGEIGEIGKENSTVDELRTFISGLTKIMDGTDDMQGIRKISVQVGATHGGIVQSDGRIKKVAIDFDRLKELSSVARNEFGLAGAVMHGASTLPHEYFSLFPEKGAIEIHLATGIQNIIFDHPKFPAGLKEDIHGHLHRQYQNEQQPNWTDEQFLYKLRKKAWGTFKDKLWSLYETIQTDILNDVQNEFDFFIENLNLKDKCSYIDDIYKRPEKLDMSLEKDFLTRNEKESLL